MTSNFVSGLQQTKSEGWQLIKLCFKCILGNPKKKLVTSTSAKDYLQTRLQSDLICVDWDDLIRVDLDVKLYSLTHSFINVYSTHTDVLLTKYWLPYPST